MTIRRAMLVALVAALAVANLAWWPLSRSSGVEQAALAEQATPPVPPKPYRNPFPSAHEVRLFVNTDYDGAGQPIYSSPKGRVLTASQRTQLEALIAVHTIAPDDEFTTCFIPHHFFRYFDKAGKEVGEIEVCFCCTGVRQSDGSRVRLTEDEILGADFGKLEAFVASLGERTDVQCEGEV